MAIAIEFISLILPVELIKEKYPNGWAGFLQDNEKFIGRTVWYDEYLCYADGGMDPEVVDSLIAKWTQLGFTATEISNGKKVWKDFCIFTSYGGSTYDCPWIEADFSLKKVWLRGTEPDKTLSRKDFAISCPAHVQRTSISILKKLFNHY